MADPSCARFLKEAQVCPVARRCALMSRGPNAARGPPPLWRPAGANGPFLKGRTEVRGFRLQEVDWTFSSRATRW